MKTQEWNWKTRDGLKIYSKEWSQEEKPKAVVCLVHGLGEHVGRYEIVAEALTSKGYGMLGFDLRGHGKSEGRRGHTPSLEAYFDDIDSFLDEVAKRYPGSPRVLYGHSLGGILVLSYAPICNPDITGVIATAAGFRSQLEKQKGKIVLAKLLGSIWPTFTLPSGLDPKTLSRDTSVVQAYIADPLVHDRVTAKWGKVMLESFSIAYGNAPKFPVPVLIMHGMKDELGYSIGSQEFADLVPKPLCTLKLWDGLYHEIHNEPEKEQVFQSMIEWMDKQIKR